MHRYLFSSFLLFILFATASSALAAGKVHVLLVADTFGRNARPLGILKDRDQMCKFFRNAFADSRLDERYREKLSLTVLDGNDATPDNVLQYYRQLRSNEDDCLFFYYSGHGAMTKRESAIYFNKHYFTMNNGNLDRDLVRRAMEAKKPRLMVLTSDCCSNFADQSSVQRNARSLNSKLVQLHSRVHNLQPNPVFVQKLFFEERGVLDITSSMSGYASIGTADGGIFTNALLATLCTSPWRYFSLEYAGLEGLSWSDIADGRMHESVVRQLRSSGYDWQEQSAQTLDYDLKEQTTRLMDHLGFNGFVKFYDCTKEYNGLRNEPERLPGRQPKRGYEVGIKPNGQANRKGVPVVGYDVANDFSSGSNKTMVITHVNGKELRSHGSLQHALYTSQGSVKLTFVESIAEHYTDSYGNFRSRDRIGRKMTVTLDLPW